MPAPCPAARQVGVVVTSGADEDAGGAAGAAWPGQPASSRASQPSSRSEPLLRVHGGGLARRDAEERGVEVGGCADVAAAQGCGATVRGGPALCGCARAPVLRGVGDGAAARGQQLPVGGRIVGAREPAREADHGHGLVTRSGVSDGGGHRLVHRWHSKTGGGRLGVAHTFARGQGPSGDPGRRSRGISRHVVGLAPVGRPGRPRPCRRTRWRAIARGGARRKGRRSRRMLEYERARCGGGFGYASLGAGARAGARPWLITRTVALPRSKERANG